MEKTAQGINPSTPRDYDKDPIVIEDYNPLFGWWETLYVVFPIFILIFLFNPFGVEQGSMISKVLLMTPFALLPMYREYKNAKNRRKIFLKNNVLLYSHDNNKVTQIDLNSIEKIHRTFDDFYHSSQNLNDFYKMVLLILFPFVVAWKMGLLLTKFIRYLIINKSINGYIVFDAIIVESNTKEILTIFARNAIERELVKEYFWRFKNIDIDQLAKRYSIFYGYEKINTGEK